MPKLKLRGVKGSQPSVFIRSEGKFVRFLSGLDNGSNSYRIIPVNIVFSCLVSLYSQVLPFVYDCFAKTYKL